MNTSNFTIFADLNHRGEQRMTFVDLILPEGANHKHPLQMVIQHQLLHELQAGVICPLDIIQEEDQRPVRMRHSLYELGKVRKNRFVSSAGLSGSGSGWVPIQAASSGINPVITPPLPSSSRVSERLTSLL